MKLDYLPKDCIDHIKTFLEPNDWVNFSQTNKFISNNDKYTVDIFKERVFEDSFHKGIELLNNAEKECLECNSETRNYRLQFSDYTFIGLLCSVSIFSAWGFVKKILNYLDPNDSKFKLIIKKMVILLIAICICSFPSLLAIIQQFDYFVGTKLFKNIECNNYQLFNFTYSLDNSISMIDECINSNHSMIKELKKYKNKMKRIYWINKCIYFLTIVLLCIFVLYLVILICRDLNQYAS